MAVSISLSFALLMNSTAVADTNSDCKIKSNVITDHATESYYRDKDVVSSIGKQDILAIAVDFQDAPLKINAVQAISEIVDLQKVEEFYSYISASRFKPTFIVYPDVVRMPELSPHYGNQVELNSFENGEWQSEHLVREALQRIQRKINFKNYSSVMVFVSGGKSLSGYVGYTSLKDPPLLLFENGEVHNFTLIGKGISKNGSNYAARAVAHELGHLVGLPDLYAYDSKSVWATNPPNFFSTMGSLQGSESDVLSWDRYILGWIDDAQVYCLATIPASRFFKVVNSTNQLGDDYQLILLKLSENSLLAIEALPIQGFFSKSKLGGFLVYTIDFTKKSGEIPISVISRSNGLITGQLLPDAPDYLRLQNAPLIENTYLTFNNIRIENYFNQLRIYSGETAKKAEESWNLQFKAKSDLKSIFCVRGKSKRTFTGTNPKCPIGYTLLKSSNG